MNNTGFSNIFVWRTFYEKGEIASSVDFCALKIENSLDKSVEMCVETNISNL